jgi:hypothetical protein
MAGGRRPGSGGSVGTRPDGPPGGRGKVGRHTVRSGPALLPTPLRRDSDSNSDSPRERLRSAGLATARSHRLPPRPAPPSAALTRCLPGSRSSSSPSRCGPSGAQALPCTSPVFSVGGAQRRPPGTPTIPTPPCGPGVRLPHRSGSHTRPSQVPYQTILLAPRVKVPTLWSKLATQRQAEECRSI